MRLLMVNPNANDAMTMRIAAVAQAAAPSANILARTNSAGPKVIEGAVDGVHAVPGLLGLLAAEMFDVAVIACFDDTGLDEARAAVALRSERPVLGLGGAACHVAATAGRFSVVTSVTAALPVIEANLMARGLSTECTEILAAGIGVSMLETDRDTATRAVIAAAAACSSPAVVLGCAGMAGLAPIVAAATGRHVIDPVHAAALVAQSMAPSLAPPKVAGLPAPLTPTRNIA